MNDVAVENKPMEALWENIGSVFHINMTFRVKVYPRLYKFNTIKKGSWHIQLPVDMVEQLGINERTHYLLFYSIDPTYIVFFFFSYEEIAMTFNFSFKRGESNGKVERAMPSGGREYVLYKLNVEGKIMDMLKKVWVKSNRYIGVTVPRDVVNKMNFNPSTLFLMHYSPEADVLILEIRNFAGGKAMNEKTPEKEEEIEDEEPEIGVMI